jgi:radical SAM/Cys-rich protein
VVTGGDRAVREKTKPGFPGEPHSERKVAVEPFAATLEKHGLSLVRGEVHTLQVNTGLLCNLRCRHCHLEAGPDRREVMSRETMSAVIAFAERFRFQAIDITGGAPEMVPDLSFLIEGLAPLAPRLMLRTNLAALAAPAREGLLDQCIARRVVLVASFPSTNPSQTDAQRGTGVAEAGIAMLRKLNAAGYGVEGSGLELNLVSNPVGAFLPATQVQAEAKFRRDLLRKWGVTFHNLYTFGNVPLGRFRQWLADSGNYDRYLRTLADGFNPCTVEGLMCRTQLSVSWDGYLYECDFNLATDRYLEGRKVHVSEIRRMPPPGIPIAVGDYCYACTAGSGFT